MAEGCFFYRAHGRWPIEGDEISDKAAKQHDAREEAWRLASLNRLSIWGRQNARHQPKKIDHEYWHDHVIDALQLQLLEPREKMTTSAIGDQASETAYRWLQVDRQQIEQIWRPRRKVKLRAPWEWVED